MELTNSKLDKDSRLADICADCLMLICQLRTTQQYGDADVLRQRILDLLNRMERQAKRQSLFQEEIHEAKYALVALLDETIITSDWEHKEGWLANPLQLQLFDRFDAGEEFFKRLEKLRSGAHDQNQVLEVYYLCLVLGFKGMYGLRDQEKLRLIIDETYHDLQRSLGPTPVDISPQGMRKDEIADVIRKEIPFWFFAIGVAAFCSLFYLLMTVISSNAADKVIDFLEAAI